MARPLRLEHSGAIWHVTARGNRKDDIFIDDRDRTIFLDHLGATVEICRWRLHAWVLMTNHYHLLLETPEPNLSRGMQRLNGPYSQGFNKRHDRVGHMFQGRYKAILVERESHLLELTRYVVLNPVRAGIVARPDDYRWSSYLQTSGRISPAEWLQTDWTLRHFGRDRQGARKRFRAFVSEGRARDYRPWKQLIGQVYLGGDLFRERIDALLVARRDGIEIPRDQRELTPRPSLDRLLEAVAAAFETSERRLRTRRRGPARKAFALLARRSVAAPLSDVALTLGVTPWSASHAATAGETLECEDRNFQRKLRLAQRMLEETAK